MKKNRINVLLGLIAFAALGVAVYNRVTQPKIAFVHIHDVYNNFEYKNELEGEFDAMKNARVKTLDSLEIQINALGMNIQNSEINKELNIEKYQYLVSYYQNKQNEFAEENQILSEKYTAQIWEQLNKYTEEYGEENGYDFIYGANGSGSIMYGETTYDLTDELKDFVNKRYEGEEAK